MPIQIGLPAEHLSRQPETHSAGSWTLTVVSPGDETGFSSVPSHNFLLRHTGDRGQLGHILGFEMYRTTSCCTNEPEQNGRAVDVESKVLVDVQSSKMIHHQFFRL